MNAHTTFRNSPAVDPLPEAVHLAIIRELLAAEKSGEIRVDGRMFAVIDRGFRKAMETAA